MINRRMSVAVVAALTSLSTVTGVVNAPAALAETAVSANQSPLSLTVSAPSEIGGTVVIGAAYEGAHNGKVVLFLVWLRGWQLLLQKLAGRCLNGIGNLNAVNRRRHLRMI